MKSENSAERRTAKKQSPLPEFALPDLKHYLMVIRERFFLAAFAALLIMALVGYFFLSEPPVYRATSTMLIDVGHYRVVDMEEVVDPGFDRREGAGQIIATHMEQLRSREFVNRVVETFDEEQRSALTAPYLEEVDGEMRAPSLARIIRSNLAASRREGTNFIGVTMAHRDPEAAALIANRVAEEYIGYLAEYSEAGNITAIRYLREQAATLRNEVETRERALQAYRAEHDLVSLEEDQNIVVARLVQLNDSLTRARLERIELDSRLDQVERYLEEGRDLLELDVIANFGSLPRLKQSYEALESDRLVMSERYLERHPSMIDNERSLAAVESQIQSNIEQALSELRASRAGAVEREQRLRAELADAERESLELDVLRVEYRVQENDLATARDTYNRITRRLDEVVVTSQLESASIRFFESASPPPEPSEPNIPRVAVIVLFLGGMVFVGLPVGLDALNSRMRSWADVENFLGRRILGEIPRVKGVKRSLRANIVARDLNDPSTIESFRSLYNQIGIASSNGGPKAILVTGTVSREGKTFVTCNLGATFAAHGRRTLIIDCDLRGPSIHKELGIDMDKGVLTFLTGDEPCEGDPMAKSELGLTSLSGNLYVLPAGGQSHKPTQFLEGPRAKAFFEWIKANFDIIIADSPPLAVFPDAFNLVKHMDELVYVCRYNGVNREVVKNYVDGFDDTDIELLGMIMNEMPTGKAASQYYSGHGYNSRKAYRAYYANKA